MSVVTVSPKYQVVIPKAIRERAGIRPGEKLLIVSYDGRIELVRPLPRSKARGFLHGLDPAFTRDADDRL
jgi:AbrB family looped-hinge helix DNA binding protein